MTTMTTTTAITTVGPGLVAPLHERPAWTSVHFRSSEQILYVRVQVPNEHIILSKIAHYITTIRNPSTLLLCPLDP